LRSRIDDTDLQILRELQSDGRLSNVDLAQRIGMSPPPCLRRVRALEEAGIITGYRTTLDQKKLGFDVSFFAFVQLSSQAGAELDMFRRQVQSLDAVRQCWILSGDVDFILACTAPDMAAFNAIVTHLTAMPNVRNLRTSLVLDKVKDAPDAPL
jgi:DNA-binding Lrp family transcriptional regulator